MPQRTHSFTARAEAIANTLTTEVHISQAFDPRKTTKAPRPKKYIAAWDTGATHSVISEKVVEECGLRPITMAQVSTAGGQRNSNVYLVNMFLPMAVGFAELRVTEGILGRGVDVLIGMDVINQGDFAVSNKDGKTMFSFRIPSVEHIDFLKKNKAVALPTRGSTPKPGRNDPCPCGSGKKYKKCCGK